MGSLTSLWEYWVAYNSSLLPKTNFMIKMITCFFIILQFDWASLGGSSTDLACAKQMQIQSDHLGSTLQDGLIYLTASWVLTIGWDAMLLIYVASHPLVDYVWLVHIMRKTFQEVENRIFYKRHYQLLWQ